MFTIVTFALAVSGLLWADLHYHKDRPIPLWVATNWSLFYLACALGFAIFLAATRGRDFAALFVAAYVLEQALSVDNLMVFIAVFSYFGIPARFQHKILYWGILGAIVFRLVFVLIGTGALAYIGRPVMLVFAALIGYAAYKILVMDQGDPEPVRHENRWYCRLTSKIWPMVPSTQTGRFFIKATPYRKPGEPPREVSGMWHMTPLFLCLVSIEVMDLMFAFDSIPVVIAVARDPLIVYTAMIFAILGLRSMYFILSALMPMLSQLGTAVGVILIFVAAKLLVEAIFKIHIDPYWSLSFVILALAGGVIASLLMPEKT